MAEAIGGLTGQLQGTVTGLGNKGMQWLDSVFPPESRAKAMNAITKFTSEKPMLASFLLSQFALSGFPLGLFIVMTISVAIFAIIVALIVAVLGSVVFILFWAGVALIFLLPTLFVTTAIATFIWLWGMATYYILKYFNEKPIPGIHTSFKDGIVDNLGADNEVTHQLADLTGQKIEGSGEEKGAQDRKEIEDAQASKKKQPQGGKENGSAGHGGGGGGQHQQQKKKPSNKNNDDDDNDDNSGGMNGHAKKATDAASGAKDKASNATGAVTGAAGGAKDKASGATGAVSGVAGGAKGAVGI